MTELPLPIAFLILFFPPSKGTSDIVDLHTFFHTGDTRETVTQVDKDHFKNYYFSDSGSF